MKVAVTGSSGFVGSALVPYLQENGIQVVRLIRQNSNRRNRNPSLLTNKSNNSQEIFWNPETGYIDIDALEDSRIDAIVNLAGQNVHAKWTESNKKRITDSRIRSTELLRRAILEMKNPPQVFISASGISFYHNFGTDMDGEGSRAISPFIHVDNDNALNLLDESARPGKGFLSELCQQWERSSNLGEILQTRVRVVNLRIGIVLGQFGGVLNKLVPIFKLGLGGKWGDGSQYMSWIGIDDLVRIIHFVIINHNIQGPVNAVVPSLVTNIEFTKTLGRVLCRPVIFSIPGWLARLAFGKEWSESTLLADYRIKPARLIENGFRFGDSELEPFLIKKLARKHL